MPDSIQDRIKKQPPFEETPVEEPEEEVVEEETPQEPVEETPEETKDTEISEPEIPQEAPEEEKPIEEPPKEEETKKRTTEQFEKLKDHNKSLKEENEKLKKKNVLDSLVPEPPAYPESPITNVVPATQNYPNLSKEDINNTFAGLVDDQGYVDTGLLVSTLNELQQKAKEAEERARQADEKVFATAKKQEDFERKELMREVHKEYPRLDPDSEQFDERLWEGVRNEVIGQWTSGKQEDVKAAAAKWSDILYGKEEEVKKADKEKLVKSEDEKRNINALGVKQTSQRVDPDRLEMLREAVRKGKKGALSELLEATGH